MHGISKYPLLKLAQENPGELEKALYKQAQWSVAVQAVRPYVYPALATLGVTGLASYGMGWWGNGSGVDKSRQGGPTLYGDRANPTKNWAESVRQNWFSTTDPNSWYMPAISGVAGSVGTYTLAKALGAKTRTSALAATVALPAVSYLASRFQQGHFNRLFDPKGFTFDNLAKALWTSTDPMEGYVAPPANTQDSLGNNATPSPTPS